MEKIVKCPNCGSSALVEKYMTKDRHYGNAGNFRLDVCRSCKLVFMNPMLNDIELSNYYPEESYYAYHEEIIVKRKQRGAIKRLVSKIIFGSDKLDKLENPGKILDIGCGNGWVLYKYKKAGWQVAGVEPSKIATELGNKAGLNIFNGTLLQAKFKNDEFDFIRSNHSFEHIYNPNETLSEIYRILKPNGELLIGVPNIAGLNSKLAGKYWFYLGAPVHTFNYSPKNLKMMLTKHGFEVSKVRYVGGANGILGSIQIYLNRNTGRPSSEGKIIKSRALQILAVLVGRVQNLFHIGDCMEVIAKKKIA